MKVICCKCQEEYLLEDNIFESENTNKPILTCPHCGFEHLLDFIPIDDSIKPKKRKIDKLNLASTYYVDLTASRIANSSRVDQSGSDDGDVIDWVKTDEIILAIQIGTSKGPIARSYKLRWRNVSDSGSFVDVAHSGGEVEWALDSETNLADGTTLGSGNKLCSATPEPTWQDGLESAEDNLLPDSGTYSLADEYYTELQWALSLDNALSNKQYEFELYDVTESTVIGTCLAQITTESPPCLPQTDSRIANATSIWQGVCDANIIDWNKNDDFILATYAIGGDGGFKVFKLQWKVSGGSFVDVGPATTIHYNAITDLVDQDPVGTPAGCLTSTVSEENEGNGLTDIITMGASDIVEVQWALDISDAVDDTTYEFQLVCTSDVTSEVCSCSITTTAGDITAYKDITLKTTLESALTYKDITLKTSLHSLDYKDITLKTSLSAAPILGYKDITLKTTLESALTYKDITLKTSLHSLDFKDIALKTTLESALTYKDITLKTSLESALTYKDISLKTTLESIPIYKDITLKISLHSLDYKDIALKTTLESTLTYKDIAIKTSINSAASFKDITLKTTLESALTYKDITLKTTLESIPIYKDIALKTSLLLKNFKDVAIKTSFELGDVLVYKDITLKTTFESALTYKDITLKTTFESISIYKDITLKTSLHSLDYKDITLKISLHSLDYKDITLKTSLHSLDYKDIALKTTLESALTYKDITLKTTLESALTYKDISLKSSLHSLDYKDIVLKTSLESALTYKDISLKISFRLEELIGYKDISLKTSLFLGGFKDISIKVSLEAIVKEIINFTSSINLITEFISSITQTEEIESSITQTKNFISKIDTN